jgi:hypothetical protein
MKGKALELEPELAEMPTHTTLNVTGLALLMSRLGHHHVTILCI